MPVGDYVMKIGPMTAILNYELKLNFSQFLSYFSSDFDPVPHKIRSQKSVQRLRVLCTSVHRKQASVL